MADQTLTATHLRALLEYAPEIGVFTWLASRSNRVKAGGVAGFLDCEGYVRITVCGRMYFAHRLAWLYVTGEWPANQIDHRDGVRNNNAIANLRDVRHSVNMQNLKHARVDNRSSGLLGVTWHARRKVWQAQMRVDGRNKFLGYHATAEQARAAYLETKRRLHPGCTI